MGVEPYLLASSLRTIISQRLVRKLSSDGETILRQGIFEILDIDQNVKELINDDSSKESRDITIHSMIFRESGQKLIQEVSQPLKKSQLSSYGGLMPAFNYEALSSDGKNKRQQLQMMSI